MNNLFLYVKEWKMVINEFRHSYQCYAFSPSRCARIQAAWSNALLTVRLVNKYGGY